MSPEYGVTNVSGRTANTTNTLLPSQRSSADSVRPRGALGVY